MNGKIVKFKIGAWFLTAFRFDKQKPKKVAAPTADVRSWGEAARGTFEHQFRELNQGRRK